MEHILTLCTFLVIVAFAAFYFITTNHKKKINSIKTEEEAQLKNNYVNTTKNETENEEVVAVIMAALCTYTGQHASTLKIKSIKLIDNDTTWREKSIFSIRPE